MSTLSLNDAVSALREAAGAVLRTDLLTVRVVGADRIRFLNGMLSNDVSKLSVGEAQRAVKASAKGRVEGLVRVRCRETDVRLDVREPSAARVAGELLKFVVMDDVQLEDASGERQVLSVHGPHSRAVLARAGFESLPERNLTFTEEPSGSVLIRDDDWGVESYELHVADASAVLASLVEHGARAVAFEHLNVVRVEAGRPLDGVDIDVDTIPLEARLDEAIDLDKGCFIGQEVIARATHRGGVKHRLVGLSFPEGEAPAGAELWPAGADASRAAGELTSSVFSPSLGRSIGLGYVRIEHEAPGTALEARWGDGQRTPAEVADVPLVK